jgi:hypothetical protein
MFTGGRVGCCDHWSEEEGKTVGNNVRLGGSDKQETRAGKLEAQLYTRDFLRKRERTKGNDKRKLSSFNRRLPMPKFLERSSSRVSLSDQRQYNNPSPQP